ncbi:hypothetical protein D3C87_1327240 [compost metagenome]
MVTRKRPLHRIRHPRLGTLAEKPALQTRHAFVDQALVPGEFVGMFGRAVAFQIGRARRHLKTLRRQNPRLQAGVAQRADAKQQVGAFLQRRDVAVGLLDIQLQLRITRPQLPQPRRQVPLAENHRRVDTHQPARLALLFQQRLLGFLQLHQHQPRVLAQHPASFGGRNGAGVAVEQLLVEGLLHQLDLPGNRRGCHAFAAGDFGKAAVIKYRNKQPKRLESQFVEAVHGQSCCASYAKVLSGCSHLSHSYARR